MKLFTAFIVLVLMFGGTYTIGLQHGYELSKNPHVKMLKITGIIK